MNPNDLGTLQGQRYPIYLLTVIPKSQFQNYAIWSFISDIYRPLIFIPLGPVLTFAIGGNGCIKS